MFLYIQLCFGATGHAACYDGIGKIMQGATAGSDNVTCAARALNT